jgi:hypothetical protein
MSRPKVLISIPTGDGWVHGMVMLAFTRFHLETAGCEVNGMCHTAKPYENNLHQLRKIFLNGPWDYWLSMDADNPPRGKNPLELAHLGLDIVGCPTPVYLNAKPGEQYPMYWNAVDAVGDGWKPHTPCDGLQEVDAIGSGCFLVSRKVMEAIKAPFLRIFDEDGVVNITGDYAFCRRAKAAGFRVWAHFDYPCFHFNELEISEVAHAFTSCRT